MWPFSKSVSMLIKIVQHKHAYMYADPRYTDLICDTQCESTEGIVKIDSKLFNPAQEGVVVATQWEGLHPLLPSFNLTL